MKGLIVASPWVELILAGKKTWEIRGRRTKFRETIALIRKGSGTIVGYVDLVDCIGPLTDAQVKKTRAKHQVDPKLILDPDHGYDDIYAWVLKSVRKLKTPKRYKHPSGAVIWVDL